MGHQATTRKSPGTWRLLAPALIAALVVLLFAQGTAQAGVQKLQPERDIFSGWHEVGASSAWSALRNSSSGRSTYIRTRRGRGVTQVALENPVPVGDQVVRRVRVRFFGRTGNRARLRVRVYWKGRLRAHRIVGRGAEPRWRSILLEPRSLDVLRTLQIQFRPLGKGSAQVASTTVNVVTAPAARVSSDIAVFDSQVLLRPGTDLPPNGSARADLVAARNEFESFQVSVEGADAGFSDLAVSLAEPLIGPGGYTIPTDNVTIYREAYYTVSAAEGKPPSNGASSPGRWPDALIPERDYIYNEDRRAFPIDIDPGARMTAWVDVLAPAGAPAGLYSGQIDVTAAGGISHPIPVRLKVLPLDIPSTTSLKSAFYISPNAWYPCRVMMNGRDCEGSNDAAWEMDYVWQRVALENRITLSNGFPGDWHSAPARGRFARYAMPLISGSGATPVPGVEAPRLPGARMTTVGPLSQCAYTAGCIGQWRALAQEFGFAKRFYAYICDEPNINGQGWSTWEDCRRNSVRASNEWPAVNRMVTTSMFLGSEAEDMGLFDLKRYTDTLAVVLRQMANRPNQWLAGNQRPTYNDYMAYNEPGTPENEVWLYTSCESYGCDESEDPYWNGWAGYAIDAPPSHARAMGWLSFLYGASAELYWNTMMHLDTAWTDQYESGFNGDGTFFYPGLPNGGNGAPAIGGSHGIPIETLRLKRMRDGREDYELMRMLSARGRGGTARNIIAGLFGDADHASFGATVSAGALQNSRCRLFEELAGSDACTIP